LEFLPHIATAVEVFEDRERGDDDDAEFDTQFVELELRVL
jgi:hypothetical protein